jgi:hypothetical protein
MSQNDRKPPQFRRDLGGRQGGQQFVHPGVGALVDSVPSGSDL